MARTYKIMFKINLVFFVFVCEQIYAQSKPPCSFDELMKNKAYIEKSEQKIRGGNQKSSAAKIIPVVVHVIHNGGAENISDAQIQSQMDVLNEDYGKMPGTNGDGNGTDTDVRFCLAKLTPDGKCTNGIVRIKSTLTNHQTYQRTQLGNLSFWDNTRYLNVYVVKTINNGSAGYASFPGGPDNDDGIVIMHSYFGKNGTASAGLGRTMTHEAGHWFGLYHTFNNGCGVDTCLDGDYVCDTPPAASPTNFNCPVKNTCSIDFPDVNDQVQNYMDYSSDACMNMFTEGQKQRMHSTLNTLRQIIWQPSSVNATGCDSSFVPAPCNVIADFTSSGKNLCTGSAVDFINKSQNNPVSYQWYFSGGNPASSALANPNVVYDSTGNFSVTLVTANAVGADSVTISNYITVTNPFPGGTLTYTEGFEDLAFPANGITLENPDNGVTWERDTLAAYAGTASVKINNLINTNYGQGDAFILPDLDLTSFSGIPYLTFKWAYARTSTIYSDELIVLLSKDCGLNFTQIFYKTGNNLATAPVQTTPFIPDSTQWKSAKVSLANYSAYNNIILKFVNVTDGGNNLYIDNVLVGDTAVVVSNGNDLSMEKILIYPNPNEGRFWVDGFQFTNENSITIYNILGEQIYQESKTENRKSFIIDIAKEPPGMYLLKITRGAEIAQKRIIKL